MYACPIFYPLSTLPEQWRFWAGLNPVAPIIELFRFSYLGSGSIDLSMLAISFVEISVILLLGIIMFNRTERTFLDTV